jgi:hypothetical protein
MFFIVLSNLKNIKYYVAWGPIPPKKTMYPSFPRFRELVTLRKLTQIVGDSIRDSRTCWLSSRRFGQISGMFSRDFRDFWADFGDIPDIYL